MTAMDRPDNGQDEGRKYLAGLRQHSTNPTLLRTVAEVEAELDALVSARAGAGEQQREQNIETLRRVLLAHHPIMRSETGPFSGCRCGQVRIGQDVIAHVADELLALLGGPQPDGEVRQHRMDPDCWCGPVQAANGAWDHQ